MLTRHIIGYFPSLVIPSIGAFAAVYCFTRLLTPAEFGHFALAMNAMTMLNALFFYWLQISLSRLLPQAAREGRAVQLKATSYIAFSAAAALMIIAVVFFIRLVPLGDLTQVAWLAIPLALTRSLLNMNMAVHRSVLNFRRYNLIECGQAVVSLVASLVLVYFFGLASFGAILGVIIGLGIMMLVDSRMVFQASPKHFSRESLREISRFGAPLVASFGFSFILSASDRFLIEYFRGSSDVGIYAAGYNVMDRILQMLFMMIVTPSFPLVIHKLEHEGVEAARTQTYLNGVAVLGMGLPACAGLLLCSEQLAAVLIGEEFRAGALTIMPWIGVGALLNCLSAHYFDHAFHLAKKPHLMLFTQGPAALLNLAMNMILIPRYGIMGAAWSTLASYLLLLCLSIALGRRAFRIHFPFGPALGIGGATTLMAAVLLSVHFPADLFGLAAMLALGVTTYGLGLVALNVMGVRSWLWQRLAKGK